jgi:hypothetical protein
MVARGETPEERQAAHEATQARHPLRDHPRFRLATAEEREDGTTLVVFVGGSTLIPGGKRKLTAFSHNRDWSIAGTAGDPTFHLGDRYSDVTLYFRTGSPLRLHGKQARADRWVFGLYSGSMNAVSGKSTMKA